MMHAIAVRQKVCAKNIKKISKHLHRIKKVYTFALANQNKVPWMSGLVSGLQNRVRRFESARNLKAPIFRSFFFLYT